MRTGRDKMGRPGAGNTVAGGVGSADGILEDSQALELAENLGRRVAETAKIIQRGIQASPELEMMYRPREYVQNYKKE